MASVTRKFLEHVVPGVLNPLRVLWNEIIGFMFLVIALVTIRPIYQHWQELNAGGDAGTAVRLLMAVVFAMFMLWFGLTSILRARRLSRNKR